MRDKMITSILKFRRHFWPSVSRILPDQEYLSVWDSFPQTHQLKWALLITSLGDVFCIENQQQSEFKMKTYSRICEVLKSLRQELESLGCLFLSGWDIACWRSVRTLKPQYKLFQIFMSSQHCLIHDLPRIHHGNRLPSVIELSSWIIDYQIMKSS